MSAATEPEWLIDAATLLARPDPGPTPWLVDRLIVDEAILAIVGRWKTTKSYGLLDICMSIAAGEPALGAFEVPNPGPVIYVCEESGEAALWRRLDALSRGRAIKPGQLADLHLAANQRVKLDDRKWQAELVGLGQRLKPRLIVFDPLVRMKAAGRDENAQTEMAPVLEFLRVLRDETHAAVGFVHHTGHGGDNMRGSSDLESVWESRLHWKRNGQSALVSVEPEHREAEAGDPIEYRIAWDDATRSIRFNVEATSARQTGTDKRAEAVVAYLAEHPEARPTRNALARAIGGKRSDNLAAIRQLLGEGTICDDNGLTLVPVPGSTPKGVGNREPAGQPVPGTTGNQSGTGNHSRGSETVTTDAEPVSRSSKRSASRAAEVTP